MSKFLFHKYFLKQIFSKSSLNISIYFVSLTTEFWTNENKDYSVLDADLLKIRYSDSSTIQNNSVTLYLVIIARTICNYLIFNHKDTKYLQNCQFLYMLFYPKIA